MLLKGRGMGEMLVLAKLAYHDVEASTKQGGTSDKENAELLDPHQKARVSAAVFDQTDVKISGCHPQMAQSIL
jgi:hypothetical protein